LTSRFTLYAIRSPASWIAQGHDPVFVSRQLGHANPAITLRVYAHLFDANRHAERARTQLETEFRHLLD
jgi:integrase